MARPVRGAGGGGGAGGTIPALGRVLFVAAIAGLGVTVPGATEAGATETPNPLTAARTERGVYLSWSKSLTGLLGVWRGTGPGSLRLLAQIPGGQAGFLDLSAARAREYWYALGDAKRPGRTISLPGRTPVRVLAGLVTTCSGLTKGRVFPADTQNYFTATRNAHVQYFGYFFLTPFDASPRTARFVWRDPGGEVLSEYEHKITPREVDIPGGKAGQVLFSQAIGLQHALPQNGQKRVPTEPGLYSVEALLDGVSVGITVFWIGKEGDQAPGLR